MKKTIVILLLLAVVVALFLPSCADSETGSSNTTTTADPAGLTTPSGTTPEGPINKTTEEMILEIDALTNKRIDEIKNTKDEITVTGTKYYVSADGNDSNSGKSPEKAWKTLSKVDSKKLSSGDAVLFRRGDTFRGHFEAQLGVTYAAYGEGAKPILIANEITDATDVSSWSLLEGTSNIWVYHKDVAEQGNIIFNDGESCAYKVTPSYKDGKAYVQLTTKEFDIKKELDVDLEFVCLTDSIIKNGVPDVENEKCVGKLYMRCDEGNPAEVFDSIEFAPRFNTITTFTDYVTIDNICFLYTGAHGVGGGNCTSLKVTNCEFGWIGGAILNYQVENGNPVRYGNAVEAVCNIKKYDVINNYIYQIYDAGITHQVGTGYGSMKMQNIRYADNVILYCSYSIEYFLGAKQDNSIRYMANVVIEDNIMRYAGFGFGNQRIDKTNPAHIKGWDHANYLKEGSEFVIRNNIMDRSRYMMIHCGAEMAAYLPTFENNVWVQYRVGTSSLGKFGANPTLSEKQFTERNFENLGIEEDPEMYTVNSKDWLWELPV